MTQILEAQANCFKLGILQAAPPYDMFLQAYAETNGKSELLGKFIQARFERAGLPYSPRSRLNLVRHLPHLLNVYQWLHEKLAFVYTMEETNDKSLYGAIQNLPGNLYETYQHFRHWKH